MTATDSWGSKQYMSAPYCWTVETKCVKVIFGLQKILTTLFTFPEFRSRRRHWVILYSGEQKIQQIDVF